jgi:ABC-2 type transport system permease protein
MVCGRTRHSPIMSLIPSADSPSTAPVAPMVPEDRPGRWKDGKAVSALANVLSHRELIENLVLRDIKARYKQSALGICWAILNPLVMALIYTLVGRYFLKQDPGIPFPVFAYYGLLFWNLFATGLTGATESLVSHLSLITKVYFPREVFPIAAVAGKLVDFLFGLVGLLPLLLVHRLAPSPAMILILPLVLVQLVFTAGLGMLFACANLFYRDMRHLILLVIALWMYLVPNIYPFEQVPPAFRSAYLLNPMAVVIETARRLTFPQNYPGTSWEYFGAFVGIAAAVSVLVFVAGYVVFKRYEPMFAESI